MLLRIRLHSVRTIVLNPSNLRPPEACSRQEWKKKTTNPTKGHGFDKTLTDSGGTIWSWSQTMGVSEKGNAGTKCHTGMRFPQETLNLQARDGEQVSLENRWIGFSQRNHQQKCRPTKLLSWKKQFSVFWSWWYIYGWQRRKGKTFSCHWMPTRTLIHIAKLGNSETRFVSATILSVPSMVFWKKRWGVIAVAQFLRNKPFLCTGSNTWNKNLHTKGVDAPPPRAHPANVPDDVAYCQQDLSKIFLFFSWNVCCTEELENIQLTP